MTYPKMKPCPRCAKTDALEVYKYDHGWQHVECDLNECGYMGPGSGSILGAIRCHNQHADAQAMSVRQDQDPQGLGGDSPASAVAESDAPMSPDLSTPLPSGSIER